MPTLEERVAALEARVDAHAMSTTDLRGMLVEFQGDTSRRFAELQDQMNRRFEQVDRRFAELQAHMNQRFDTVDQKIDRHFTWLVGMMVTGFLAVIGTVASAFWGLLQTR